MKTEFDYTVAELFEMLKEDESWEPDPDVRAQVADALLGGLLACE